MLSTAQGGEENVVLSEEEMPSHNHSGKTSEDGKHTHTDKYYFATHGSGHGTHDRTYDHGSRGEYDQNKYLSVEETGQHRHKFTTSSAGGNKSHENRPPYYAAYFIMKSDSTLSGYNNEYLLPGEKLTSANLEYELVFQQNCDLVLYKTSDRKELLSFGTSCKYPSRAKMQSDGNFIVYQYTDETFSKETYVKKSLKYTDCWIKDEHSPILHLKNNGELQITTDEQRQLTFKQDAKCS